MTLTHSSLWSDAQGFTETLRDWVRHLYVPSFDWQVFDYPSPRHRLEIPLSQARVGLVTTGGARLPDHPRFDTEADEGDPSFRVIPSDIDVKVLKFNHPGYDVRRAYKDPDVVFPLRLAQRYAEQGRINSVAPRAYSFMGYITQYDVLLHETAPAVAEMLVEDQVDLVLLVPA